MTTLSLSTREPRTRALGIALTVGVMAVAAQVAIPIPGTPVPFSLQPMLVVLAGLLLGPADAAMAMAAYLVAGAAGLPVFAPMGAPAIARLVGPTGGYLLAYPVAASIAGRIGAGQASFARRTGAALAGMLALYVGGVAQLAVITGGLREAALLGVLPFAAADAVKSLVAAALAGTRDRARR